MSTHRGTAAAAASSTSQSWWSPAAASVPSQEAAGRDYYSLDDILSSHQRVPCRIEQPIYRLGFLNTSSAEAHLLPGSKLELPVWLARRLCSKHVVSVQLPRQYRASQRTILSADAKVVDLHRLGPHYYSVGVQLLSLLEGDEEEASELSRSLLETFLNRFQHILDTSLNAFQSDGSALTRTMDELERHLFSLGQRTVEQQTRWESGCGHIMSSSLMLNSRKRKRQSSNSIANGQSQ